jgi:putative drug exporter of the RND superfamily
MMNMHKNKYTLWIRLALPLLLVVTWLAVSAIGGPYFGRISDISSNDLTTFLPKNAEATKVNSILNTFQGTNTVPAIVAFQSPSKFSDAATNSINTLRDDLGEIKGVKGAIPPAVISDDGKAALVIIPLERAEKLETIFAQIASTIDRAHSGIDHKVGGPASFSRDIQNAFSGIDVTLLLVALTVVFAILLAVYRSPLLPIIVLLTAMAALSAAIWVVWHMADAGYVEINGQVQGILFILVIGATTDYSLLYLARLREELYANETTVAAIKAALKGSFEAILAAGGTVTIGLMCLLLSDLGSNKSLGPVGGVGIIFAILSALTFLPAMLLLIGRIAFWPRKPAFNTQSKTSYMQHLKAWAWVGRLVQKHPRRLWVGSTVVLLIACTGVFQLKAEGVSQSNLVLGYSEAREAQTIIDTHFPAGSGTPAIIITKSSMYQAVVTKLEQDKGVDAVEIITANSPSNTIPVGRAKIALQKKILRSVSTQRQAELQAIRTSIEQKMAGAPAAAIDQAYLRATATIPTAEQLAASAYPFKNTTPKIVDGTVVLEATLTDPADSSPARGTIVRLRSAVKTVDSSALVGGMAAIQYDTNEASMHDRAIITPLVLFAITIILGILLRAIVAPIILLFTTLLSFGTTLGVSAFVFNTLWNFPGADSSVILFGFIFLVALGIDYNIFLMTRVREETIKLGVQTGTIKALVVTGGVITSAGVVLAATFAALGVIPVLFLAQIAFIVAFGVLLDTLIVRSLLTPALTMEVGRWMWWPSRLSKK